MKGKKKFDEPVVEDTSEMLVEEEPVVEEIERVEAEVVMTGVVTANMLNIRSGPGLSFLPCGTLYKGDKVEYTVENDEWVKLANRKASYCMKQFIR